MFIHPFIDGNGRVARLILNLALIRGEYTIALIPAILRHEYVQSLEMSHKNPAVFVDFITDRIIATQMDLLRLLNVFVKPDEQNETCFNSAMARKRRMKSNDGGVNGGVNGGENEKRGGVNLEELLFDAIRNNPGLNAPTLAEMLQKSLRTVQRYLKQLTENERIEFRGAPKNGGYHVIVK